MNRRTILYNQMLDASRARINRISIVGQSGQQLSTAAEQNVIHDIQNGPGPNNDLVRDCGFLKNKL
jgi:hypothetical protein